MFYLLGPCHMENPNKSLNPNGHMTVALVGPLKQIQKNPYKTSTAKPQFFIHFSFFSFTNPNLFSPSSHLRQWRLHHQWEESPDPKHPLSHLTRNKEMQQHLGQEPAQRPSDLFSQISPMTHRSWGWRWRRLHHRRWSKVMSCPRGRRDPARLYSEGKWRTYWRRWKRKGPGWQRKPHQETDHCFSAHW